MLETNVIYTLAQADAPAPAPQQPTAPVTGEGTAPPAGTEQQAVPKQGTGPDFWGTMLFPIALLLIFWVLIFMPQRKERKRRAELLTALKKGDKVQTIGGVRGIVTAVKDDEVVVKVDEDNNTKIRYDRSAIQTILSDAKPAETK